MAAHVLVLLSLYPEELMTSENISQSVGVNPVVIRRLMGMLRRAGLVAAKAGANGGSALAVPPESISLSAVYIAVEEGSIIKPHGKGTSKICPVGRNIHEVLRTVSESVDRSVDETLARVSIADLAARLRALGEPQICGIGDSHNK